MKLTTKLERAIVRLQRLQKNATAADKAALALAIEHIENRLIDIRESGDWREGEEA